MRRSTWLAAMRAASLFVRISTPTCSVAVSSCRWPLRDTAPLGGPSELFGTVKPCVLSTFRFPCTPLECPFDGLATAPGSATGWSAGGGGDVESAVPPVRVGRVRVVRSVGAILAKPSAGFPSGGFPFAGFTGTDAGRGRLPPAAEPSGSGAWACAWWPEAGRPCARAATGTAPRDSSTHGRCGG